MAIILTLTESEALRIRLGIKKSHHFHDDYDFSKLINIILDKQKSTDPKLRIDIEREINKISERATAVFVAHKNLKYGCRNWSCRAQRVDGFHGSISDALTNRLHPCELPRNS